MQAKGLIGFLVFPQGMPQTRELQRREGDYIGPQSVLHKRKNKKKTPLLCSTTMKL